MKRLLLAAVAVACLTPVAAAAQTAAGTGPITLREDPFARDRNVSVRERRPEGYSPLGRKLGGFTLFGTLPIELEFNDNVLATPSDEQEDVLIRVRPELQLRSNWSRHALVARARATATRYSDFETENVEDIAASLDGRLDVIGRSYLFGGTEVARLTEPRIGSAAPIGAAEPVRYDVLSANAGGVWALNRLRFTGRVDLRDLNFDDVPDLAGGVLDQDARDRRIVIGTGRAEYAVSPTTAVFVSASINDRDYENPTPTLLGPAERDSSGYDLSAGANFDLTNLLRGEVQAGWFEQEYDSAAFQTASGLSVRGLVEWFPTQLTTVTLRADRTAEDSAEQGVGSVLATDFSARVDHELLRNVVLFAQAGLGEDEFQDIDRTDERRAFSAGARYLMNRNVAFDVAISRFDYDSDAPATALFTNAVFEQTRLTAGVTLRF